MTTWRRKQRLLKPFESFVLSLIWEPIIGVAVSRGPGGVFFESKASTVYGGPMVAGLLSEVTERPGQSPGKQPLPWKSGDGFREDYGCVCPSKESSLLLLFTGCYSARISHRKVLLARNLRTDQQQWHPEATCPAGPGFQVVCTRSSSMTHRHKEPAQGGNNMYADVSMFLCSHVCAFICTRVRVCQPTPMCSVCVRVCG